MPLVADGLTERVVSVDVFDTLLHRTPVSERRRLSLVARRFVRIGNFPVPPAPDLVHHARTEAQRFAYRSLDVAGSGGEVRIETILTRQLALLGLPQRLLGTLLRAEIETEKVLLRPNRALCRRLLSLRAQGVRTIAISDTGLPGWAVEELIRAVTGAEPVERVYSSADMGLTKRRGDIFAAVAEREGVSVTSLCHVGDDMRADLEMPAQAGASAKHVPRSRTHILRRRSDGAWFTMWRPRRRRVSHSEAESTAEQFGRDVIGPVLAEYCLRLWSYLASVQPGQDAVALFCARGGLNLRVVFEAFLLRTALPLELPRRDFMVSRLVALRSALAVRADAAFDELLREFAGASLADVARALTQRDCAFGPEWAAPFRPDALWSLMQTTAPGADVYAALTTQNERFTAHLRDVIVNASRVVLCDTGLYGSTLRMLAAGYPDRAWECVLFARCNYKAFSASHFPHAVGLVVEQDGYTPLARRSAILRYWQLVEHILEPDLPSVTTFSLGPGGHVASNLEVDAWRERLGAAGAPLLHGALTYVEALPRGDWFERVLADAERGWTELRRAILFPTAMDVYRLTVGPRSIDLGRPDKVDTSRAKGRPPRSAYASVRDSHWREGSVSELCGAWQKPLLIALEVAQIARAVRRAAAR
jgi:FMN phosphatase YigB (HAD superfamily)